jgi:hypothetical protein
VAELIAGVCFCITNRTLDWQLNEIFDLQSTKVGRAKPKAQRDSTGRFSSWHTFLGYPPLNLFSQLPELWQGLSYSPFGLESKAEGLLERTLCQHDLNDQDRAELLRIKFEFRVARLALVTCYFAANFFVGPIYAVYFSDGVRYESSTERGEHDIVGASLPSTDRAYDELRAGTPSKQTAKDKTARQQGITLEKKALARLQESWKKEGAPAEASLVREIGAKTDVALGDLKERVAQIKIDNDYMHSQIHVVHNEMREIKDMQSTVERDLQGVQEAVQRDLRGVKEALDTLIRIAHDGEPP